jgi:hypothetical protein
MPFTYVIPDLHGRYDLLMEAVVKIIEQSKVSRSATIVTLGDYVDRGPKSRKIIERLMGWISPDLKLICLKGNHEDMMWQCCHHPIRAGWWMENGGGATLVSYGQREGEPVVTGIAEIDWQAKRNNQLTHESVELALLASRKASKTRLWLVWLKTLRGLPLVLARAREWLRTVGRRGSREAVAKLTTLALRCVVRWLSVGAWPSVSRHITRRTRRRR